MRHFTLLLIASSGLALASGQRGTMASYQHPGYQETPLVFVKRGYRFMAPVSVNGHTTHLFIDTGGCKSAIDPHMIEALGLEFIRTGKRYLAERPNGTKTLIVHMRKLAVGQVSSENVRAISAPAPWRAAATGNRSGYTEAGTLGSDFLREHNAIIDCQRGSLFLRTDERASDFTRQTLRAQGWTAIPFQFGTQDHLLAPVAVKGKNGCFIVDTGAPISLLNRSAARRLKVPFAKEKFQIHGVYLNDNSAAIGTLAGLQIGAYDASAPFQVAVSQAWESILTGIAGCASPCLGILGVNFLIRNQAIIDYPSQMLYLKQRGR